LFLVSARRFGVHAWTLGANAVAVMIVLGDVHPCDV